MAATRRGGRRRDVQTPAAAAGAAIEQLQRHGRASRESVEHLAALGRGSSTSRSPSPHRQDSSSDSEYSLSSASSSSSSSSSFSPATTNTNTNITNPTAQRIRTPVAGTILSRKSKAITIRSVDRNGNNNNNNANNNNNDDNDNDDDNDTITIPSAIRAQLQQALNDADTNLNPNDVLFEEDEEAIREIEEEMGPLEMGRKAAKYRYKRSKRGPVRDPGGYKLSENQAEVIGRANIAYTKGEFQTAISLIHSVIKVAPMAYQAWTTLATVYEELGDMDRALQTYLVAAHISTSDGPLWRRLGSMSSEAGLKEQAIYCYTRAIRSNRQDVDALWDRSVIYEQLGHIQMTLADLFSISAVIPDHMLVVKQISRLLVGTHDSPKAIALFMHAIETDIAAFTKKQSELLSSATGGSSTSKDPDAEASATGEEEEPYLRMGFEELNMLWELLFENGNHAQALSVLTDGVIRSYRWGIMLEDPSRVTDTLGIQSISTGLDSSPSGAPDSSFDNLGISGLQTILGDTHFAIVMEQLPLELKTKLAISHLYTTEFMTTSAFQHLVSVFLEPLYSLPKSELKEFVEIFYEVIDSLMATKYYTEALKLLNYIGEEADDSRTWKRMAISHHCLGHYETAITLYEAVVEANPDDNDSRIALAEINREFGDTEKAAQWLQQVEGASGAHLLTGTFADVDANKRLSLLEDLSHGLTGENALNKQSPRRRGRSKQNVSYSGLVDDDDDELSEYAPSEDDGTPGQRGSRKKRKAFITKSMPLAHKNKERMYQRQAEEKTKSIENRNLLGKINDLYDNKDDFIARADFLRHAHVLIARFAKHKPLFMKDYRSRIIKERRSLLPQRHRHDAGGGYGRTLGTNNEMQTTSQEKENDGDSVDDDSSSESDNDYQLYSSTQEDGPSNDLQDAATALLGRLGKSQPAPLQQLNSAQSTARSSAPSTPKKLNRKPVKTSFQGLTFDEWYQVFIRFAVVAVMSGKEEMAANALMTAAASSVYHKDEHRRIMLRLHMLAVATYGGNATRVNEICRWFCQYAVFLNDTYRLFTAMQCGGMEVVSCFAMSSNIKYFQRQMKQMARNIQKDPDDEGKLCVLLLCLYGHLLQAGRSYLQAIGYFMKAYDLIPNDPLVNFSLGLAHLQRAMQRKSENRHLHIMQAYTFIFKYRALRLAEANATDDTIMDEDETPLDVKNTRKYVYEVMYNIGRSFHHIGIYNLAVEYYEKVLQLHDEDELYLTQCEFHALSLRGSPRKKASKRPKIMNNPGYFNSRDEFERYDLSREAAYNLSLIYLVSGSPFLSQALLKRYCCV